MASAEQHVNFEATLSKIRQDGAKAKGMYVGHMILTSNDAE